MNDAAYLHEQLTHHISMFFERDCYHLFQQAPIAYLTYDEAIRCKKKCIAIPIDIPSPVEINDWYSVPFNHTDVVFWNRLPKPSGKDWESSPSEAAPLWYKNRFGTIIPAWNLFRVLFDLLTFREDQIIPSRDPHGRFQATTSPRYRPGLLETPIFNNAAAVLVAALIGMEKNASLYDDLGESINHPVVILSHDVDNLLGSDVWTQAIRLYRVFQPILHGKKPQLRQFEYFFKNAMNPREHFFNDIGRIVEIETLHQYVSSFYFLNGTGGRFGARSKSNMISDAIKQIPSDWNIGIHYNYDTHLDSGRFELQANELKEIIGFRPSSGRAHYLRFDADESFNFFDSHQICYDESAGYSDIIGYRCGIAGPFKPYKRATQSTHSVWEIPLSIMDQTIVQQYPVDYMAVFNRHLDHISKVGGAISLLFHTGFFQNPEFAEFTGIYTKMISSMKQMKAQGTTCTKLLENTPK